MNLILRQGNNSTDVWQSQKEIYHSIGFIDGLDFLLEPDLATEEDENEENNE
jgi:hypothetical protein